MRLPKKHLLEVVKKRLIEFILAFSIISIVFFGTYMVVSRSGTGILYKLDDNWYIDSGSRNNYSYFSSILRIRNPDSFPHILIPENNGTKVHYIRYTRDPMLAILGPPKLLLFFI